MILQLRKHIKIRNQQSQETQIRGIISWGGYRGIKEKTILGSKRKGNSARDASQRMLEQKNLPHKKAEDYSFFKEKPYNYVV